MLTVVAVKTGADEDQRRIEFSDGSIFSFKICYLPPLFSDERFYSPGVAEGLEVNAAEEAGFRCASACMRAEKAALQLIARAEQTVFGLSRKLEKRGHDTDNIHAVITRLCELGLLDDRRYARLWAESRINRQATSPRRLLLALCARAIDRHDAEQALKETLDDETEQRLLERYVQKQQPAYTSHTLPDGDSMDSAARRSLRYLLKNEGFSSSSIQNFFDAMD